MTQTIWHIEVQNFFSFDMIAVEYGSHISLDCHWKGVICIVQAVLMDE